MHQTTLLSKISCPLEQLRKKYEDECLSLVHDALVKTQFNKSQAAELLGLHRTTLIEFLRRVRPDLIGEPYTKGYSAKGRQNLTASSPAQDETFSKHVADCSGKQCPGGNYCAEIHGYVKASE